MREVFDEARIIGNDVIMNQPMKFFKMFFTFSNLYFKDSSLQRESTTFSEIRKVALHVSTTWGVLFCGSRKLTYFHGGKRNYSVTSTDFGHKNSDGIWNIIFPFPSLFLCPRSVEIALNFRIPLWKWVNIRLPQNRKPPFKLYNEVATYFNNSRFGGKIIYKEWHPYLLT